MTKDAAANTWNVAASIPDRTDADALPDAVTVVPNTWTFGTDGQLTSSANVALTVPADGTDPAQAITLSLGGAAPLVQFGGSSTAEAVDQNGQTIGFLRDFAIGDDGSVFGQFSNGESKLLGRVVTATFNNPAGLVQRIGDSQFIETPGLGSGR